MSTKNNIYLSCIVSNFTPRQKMIQETHKTELKVCILSLVLVTCIKFLLIPAYRSTDFDVHRNWLSITHHLPVSQWYFDDNDGTTVHTLDYPPLFALFEYLLSNNPLTKWAIQAELVDQRCFEILPDNDNQPTDECIFFQRFTVILSDFIFICGALAASNFVHDVRTNSNITENSSINEKHTPILSNATISTLLITLNPGILLLDHVHFQYNGMLLGLLLLSLGFMARSATYTSIFDKELNIVISAFFFGTLLTMKHLYLTLAPLYFIYLLRFCCFHPYTRSHDDTNKINEEKEDQESSIPLQISIKGFTKLAVCTLSTLILPFLPFIISSYKDEIPQISQMLKRLFPFARGLCHDYWAANVWALYLFGDKCLSFISKTVLGRSIKLFEISPFIAAMTLLTSLIPALIYAWYASESILRTNALKIKQTPNRISMEQRKLFFIHGVVSVPHCLSVLMKINILLIGKSLHPFFAPPHGV